MNCIVCNSKAVAECHDGLLCQCFDCSHVWQTDLKVTAKYDHQYVKDRYDKYPTTEAMSYLRLGFVKAFKTQGRILDVGYGNGAFLKAAKKSGFDVFGADVHGVDYGITDVSIKEAIGMDWDVVTFFDSLEHFDDLDPIRRLADKAKMIVVSMPQRPSTFPRDLGWRHYRPGEHLHFATEKSLGYLFNNHELVKLSDLEDSIRGKLNGLQNIFTAVYVMGD